MNRESDKTLKAILVQSRKIEEFWGDSGHDDRLNELQDSLTTLENHSSAVLVELSHLSQLITPQMELRNYLPIVVAIERACDAVWTDADLKITTQDLKHSKSNGHELVFILDQIRSAFNVGSIFRIADCVGGRKVYLCGYTATPEMERTRKTSLGADKNVDWQWCRNAEEAIHDVKSQGYRVYALETVEEARDMIANPLQGKVALVVGNERYGLDKTVLESCDEIVRIPVFGIKNSLNVATAIAIAAYSCLDGLEVRQ